MNEQIDDEVRGPVLTQPRRLVYVGYSWLSHPLDPTLGRLLHTLAAHSDYVTRLAAAPDRRLVVSAGLQGEVFSYDVEVRVK